MFEVGKSKGCIRTKQDGAGTWSAWTDGLSVNLVTNLHTSEAKAIAVLMSSVRSAVEELQAFLRFPPVNTPEGKESGK